MMEEEKEVITFEFERFETCATTFWLHKYVDGKSVDCQIVYVRDLWREE
jgi:hypothetical protein